MTFGGTRVEAALARKLLHAVEPMAIEAVLKAERMRMGNQDERRRIVELELPQARYEASLAERRYAACDPDSRSIAAQCVRASSVYGPLLSTSLAMLMKWLVRSS